MKTIKKLSVQLFIIADILLKTSTVFSQSCIDIIPLGTPNRYEIQPPTGDFLTVTTGSANCTSPATGTLVMPGMGINVIHPQWMLDILSDPAHSTKNDINISSKSYGVYDVNTACYRIGDSNVLCTQGGPGGIKYNIFVGENCPVLNLGGGIGTTCVGYSTASQMFSGQYSTYLGALSGTQEQGGYFETFCGAFSGGSDAYGAYNTFIGDSAGFRTSGCIGCAPAYGDYNTFCGDRCGLNNFYGIANCYYGKQAAYNNQNGSANSVFGSHAGWGIPNVMSNYDSNSFYGNYAAHYFNTGESNVIMGIYSGSNTGKSSGTPSNWNTFVGPYAAPLNYYGNLNVTLGYKADAYTGTTSPGPIYNACAIGALATAKNNNTLILGNNQQFTGIGLSSNNTGPGWNLELCTENNPTYSMPGLGGGIATFGNTYGGTGFSGLKFRDLTSFSQTVDIDDFTDGNPYPTGFLSVDGYGNVIYVNPTTIMASIGTCTSPTVLNPSAGGDILMNSANFYFDGNGAGSSVDNVGVGYTGCSSLPAKFSVNQNSGTPNSYAAYIENDDVSNGSNTSPSALIGLKSFVPGSTQYYGVAGWFESPTQYLGMFTNTVYYGNEQYAIFVPGGNLPAEDYEAIVGGPNTGGTVDIGFQFAYDIPDYLLDVNSVARIDGTVVPSDSMLKQNVSPFTYGLKAIRNLNPISYKYNGMGGFDKSHTYIGLIAQNLARNVPNAVMPSHIIKDTISRDTATILNIYEEAVMYTAINAIKQLDSTVTSNKHNDSIIQTTQQHTIDSFRTMLTNLQNCCNEHSSIHHSGGNGNSDDNMAGEQFSNTQDVSLSATNEPLLYQNTPNPFSSGTKINYYLPEGTQGATMLFYDSYGSQLKVVELNQTGNGTLNVTSDNLSAGIYSYSLVVNGKVIDTKRMILQK